MHVFFVIDAGKYEWQSVLLTASLRQFASGVEHVTAFVPQRRVSVISPKVLAFQERMGVAIDTLQDNDAFFASRYDHGNKVLAAQAMSGRGDALFLDTDTVFCRETDVSVALGEAFLAGVSTKGQLWATRKTAKWAELLNAAGYPPSDGEALEQTLPHLNGGVIFFRDQRVFGPTGDQTLGEAWLDMASRIDRLEFQDRRPWVDQLSLCIVARMLPPESVRTLDDSWNHSLVNDLEPLRSMPKILHYHGGNRTHKLRRNLGMGIVNMLLRDDEDFGDINDLVALSMETQARHIQFKEEAGIDVGANARRHKRWNKG
ncbi:MAG: hypothetical protein AAFQ36_01385 [Pseudomonadota bacterium]